MRFISVIFCLSLFVIPSCKRLIKDVSEFVPEYKLIKEFSKNLNEETQLVLYSYGININSKPCNVKDGVADFSVGYFLFKDREDVITLQDARSLLVLITERFLQEINSNKSVMPYLDVFPFSSDQVMVSVSFKDENKIDLGDGVACVCLYKGKITYEKYEIEEYRSVYPSIGKHYVIHEETYQKALGIVKSNDSLVLTKGLK